MGGCEGDLDGGVFFFFLEHTAVNPHLNMAGLQRSQGSQSLMRKLNI